MSIMIGNNYYHFKVMFPAVATCRVRKGLVKNLGEAIVEAREQLGI